MLRQVDGGRAGFCFSIQRKYLGGGGKDGLAGQKRWPTLAVDPGSDDFFFAAAEQEWQAAVCGGRAGAWGVGSLRRKVGCVLAISFGNFRGERELFERWAISGVCELPGGNAVDEPGGRQSARAAELSAVVRDATALVARWEADCVL